MPDFYNSRFNFSFSKFAKTLGIGALAILLLYLVISVSTIREKSYDDSFIKNQIDSLMRTNAELQNKQLYYDSLNNVYQNAIYDLDYKLDNIKTTKTVIKKYYDGKSTRVKGYNSSEVDSFFRDRYKY